jgi:[protein-PII] uridylyltransferase
MGTRERRERSDNSDILLADLFRGALRHCAIPEEDISLSAVGGYGRGELSPGSDLDILFIHSGLSHDLLSGFIKAMLDPLWKEGRQIDYSIRTRKETRQVAIGDLKVALGLLDSRHVVGNALLHDGVYMDAMNNWRRNFEKYLTRVRDSIEERSRNFGELAFLLEPDLKESRGGLRDILMLRAIAASEYVPVALERIAEAEAFIWQVRDVLHTVTSRIRNQLLLTDQDAVAENMSFVDADALLLDISKAARAVDYTMQLTWHDIDVQQNRSWFRKPISQPVAKGLELFNGEIILSSGYNVSDDPGILFRMATIAAERGHRISMEALVHVSENSPEISTPWSTQSREDLVGFIGAGTIMVDVFESIDQENLISRWIPEWEHVRFLPQRNVLHHHTVDRHMLETASKAAALTRRVHRPDLLLIAALFHDLGKGFPDRDHSDYGAELIYPLALRMGFSKSDAETLALLIKYHLLLPTVATRRNIEDPSTIDYVVGCVQSAENLELLHALSISDGEATGRNAWTPWKAQLVQELVTRTLSAMQGIAPQGQPELTVAQLEKAATGVLSVDLNERDDSLEIEIIAPDSMGLLASISAVFTVMRLEVRSAKTTTVNGVAVTHWIVHFDINVPIPTVSSLRDSIERALEGTEDLQVRISERIRNYQKSSLRTGIRVAPPVVLAITQIVTDATIIEVRMHDQPGLLYTVASAMSEFGVDIKGAIVSTLGAEAFDTLYVTDKQGAPLSVERAEQLAADLQAILTPL